MPDHPDRHALEALRAFDTPTICNALEIVAPARRTIGFTRRQLIAPFPELKPVVGFARTALIRSREPHPRDRDSATRIRLGYYEHIAAEPLRGGDPGGHGRQDPRRRRSPGPPRADPDRRLEAARVLDRAAAPGLPRAGRDPLSKTLARAAREGGRARQRATG